MSGVWYGHKKLHALDHFRIHWRDLEISGYHMHISVTQHIKHFKQNYRKGSRWKQIVTDKLKEQQNNARTTTVVLEASFRAFWKKRIFKQSWLQRWRLSSANWIINKSRGDWAMYAYHLAEKKTWKSIWWEMQIAESVFSGESCKTMVVELKHC